MPTIIADSGVRRVGAGYTRLLLATNWHPASDRIASVAIHVGESPRGSHVTATSEGGTSINFDLNPMWWESVPGTKRWQSVETDRTTRRLAERALAALWQATDETGKD